MKNQSAKNKRRRNLMIVIGLLSAVMATAIAVSSIRLFASRVREDRTAVCDGAAKLAAGRIDGDKVDGWLENGEDEAYKETAASLQSVLADVPFLEYLYVYQIRPDGCHVVFDVDTESLEGSPLGDTIEFDESFLPILPTLLDGGRIDPMETDDQYGWLLTCYEPITDSTGRCVAYAGVDVAMTEVREYIIGFLTPVVLITLGFLIACIIIARKISIRNYEAEDMDVLVEQQKRDKMLLREIIESFAKVIDFKDSYTQGHSQRVANYTAMFTRELGYDDETVEKYYYIALMHDIGKIAIPDNVLNKPGRLTDEEYALIKSHAAKGYEALQNISLMPEIATGAGSHHERPDGKGYPNGLTAEEMPRVAQIIAVADTFDAMYSDRPYRKRMNFERAVSIIKEVAGTQLTPDVVEAFLRLVDKGELRAPDDTGGGTTEDISNIHDRQNSEAAEEKKEEKEEKS